MPTCPTLHNLKLDEQSLNGVEKINRKIVLTKLGASLMASGVVIQIFARSNSSQAVYNISQTDWELFGSAVNSWSAISRRAIEDVAQEQMLDHMHDQAQYRFWGAVANGCRF
ncbi:hypothetical protein [Pseudomonas indica]|uniref:hypothetical protein n=1 Tax=Pseudomonas indica TaxID=137658 RepID=UPI0023F8CBD7|nr:hypothetical protein [Pseudomonas indica]MBU3055417.1 hypothetical protein [Pseudomonas indica]